MKSKPKLFIAIPLLILIFIFIGYMWPFNKQTTNQSSPKITETKTFSCPGLEGFTFEYPVFEGWKNSKVKPSIMWDHFDDGTYGASVVPNSCELVFEYTGKSVRHLFRSDTQRPPAPVIISVGKELLLAFSDSKKNPFGVAYLKNENEARFTLGEKSGTGDVTIKVSQGSFTQAEQTQFFQTVINSFRITSETVFGKIKNNTSRKEDVSESFRTRLPEKGILLISGGTMTPHPITYVVDLINNTLNTDGKVLKLSIEEQDKITSLSNAIWASKSKFANSPPESPDWNLRLILVDGNDVKDINSYGRPVDEASELYDYVIKLTNTEK